METSRFTLWQSPVNAAIEMADRRLLRLYGHVGRQTRRATALVVSLLPLLVLLVGSCKTPDTTHMSSAQTAPEQFQAALFPDRDDKNASSYHPAAGYVARAQAFLASTPERLAMLTRQEIGYLYGTPVLKRVDADAEIWQYKAEGCVVDFYFYDKGVGKERSPLAYVDVRSGDDLVRGTPIRDGDAPKREQSRCLKSVSRGIFSLSAA